MIKAIASSADRTLVVLGLSERNLELLREGRPMRIPLGEMLPPGVEPRQVDVVIMWGATEASLMLDLEPMIGPDTKINVGEPQ